MKLDIIKVPNSILKQKSVDVKEVNEEIKQLIDDMFETMYYSNGIGLSAIQIGKPIKLIVVDLREESEDKKKNPLVFINAKIVKYSNEKEAMNEGCLSVPGQNADILRSLNIEVEYNDINMNKKKEVFNGKLAHCLQHEIDHTNGIVYIDYLSKLKRDTLIKKSQKYDKLNNK